MRRKIIFVLLIALVLPVLSTTYDTLLPLAIAEEEQEELSQSQLNSQLFTLIKNPRNASRVKTLIEKGADANAKDNYSRTPLIKATENAAYIDIVKALIESGADVNHKDNLGNTPLMNATLYGNEGIIKILTDAGATISDEEKDYVDKKIKQIAAEKEAERLYMETKRAAEKLQAEIAEQQKAIADEQAKKAREIEEAKQKEKSEQEGEMKAEEKKE